MAAAISGASSDREMAVLIRHAAAPASIARTASDGTPMPASTTTGTLTRSARETRLSHAHRTGGIGQQLVAPSVKRRENARVGAAAVHTRHADGHRHDPRARGEQRLAEYRRRYEPSRAHQQPRLERLVGD